MKNEVMVCMAIVVIMVTLVIEGGLFYFVRNKSDKHINIINGISVAIIGVAGLIISALGLVKLSDAIYNINNINNYYGISSPTEMLEVAKLKYDAKDIEGVIEIYLHPQLKNNPLVCSNLGYLYAKGEYVEKSLDDAKEYFEKAIAVGYEEAYLKIFAMYLENDLEMAGDYLVENQEEECIKELIEEYEIDLEQNKEQIATQLKNKFLVEKYMGSIVSSQFFYSDSRRRYVLISTDRSLDKDAYTYQTLRTYEIYEWVIVDAKRLKYVFEKDMDSEFDN